MCRSHLCLARKNLSSRELRKLSKKFSPGKSRPRVYNISLGESNAAVLLIREVRGVFRFGFAAWKGAITVQNPHSHERLVEAIKELTAEIRRMVERIRRQLRDMEKRGLGKNNGRKRRRGKPPA